MAFALDLVGRVQNMRLPATKPLLPLFEAITNSIHAINDAEIKNGKIDISIIRDPSQQPLQTENATREPVTGFEIVDNGVGFNDANYHSFGTSDTTLKKRLGGKGVGRFSWLWAFQQAEVTSTFRDNGSFKRRSFCFRLSKEGIEKHSVSKASDTISSTSIKLLNFKPQFSKICPVRADTIGFRIIEHFLQFFAMGTCPIITIHDICEESPIVLNKLFTESVQFEEQSVPCKVQMLTAVENGGAGRPNLVALGK